MPASCVTCAIELQAQGRGTPNLWELRVHRMKILYVAMASSIHVARFLNQVNHLGWDLHLHSSADGWEPYHPLLRNITLHGCRVWPRPPRPDPSVRLEGYWPFSRGGKIARVVGKTMFPTRSSSAWKLAQLIKTLRPDVVHSHEFQHSAYLMLDALKHVDGKMPAWIVTNWGSDIYHYGRLKRHEPSIRAVLAKCNYYTCECERDVQLARQFGFAGEILQPVMPNPGGFRFDEIDPLRTPGPVSARRIILLKGYQGMFGRALTGLVALEMCKELLYGYKVIIYSASPEVADGAEMLAASAGLNIECVPHTEDYNAILRLRGQSRVSIGLSISDAASISFLEALAMGCYPIQSDRGSAHEWIRDGEGGAIVHPEDPCSVASALRTALTNDNLVDRAAEINERIARERMDFYKLREQVIGWYERIQRENGDTQAPKRTP